MAFDTVSQQPQSRLLSLPRELRDEIYRCYLQAPGGYAHSPLTNQLRCYDGRLIDLGLMRTCKMAAVELQDLPLEVNEVVFKPVQDTNPSIEGSDIWSTWSQAGKYDFLLDRMHFLQEEAFAVAARTYPLGQRMRNASERYGDSCIGEVLGRIMKVEQEDYVPIIAVMGSPRSLTYHDREVLQNGLLLSTSHADLAERLRSRSWCLDILSFAISGPPSRWCLHLVPVKRRPATYGRVDKWRALRGSHEKRSAEELSPMALENILSTIATTHWKPWVIPTEEQMCKLRALFALPCPSTWANFKDDLPNLRYFRSATSQAIYFLASLQTRHRKRMRKIKILEEEKCVALPECHLRGLLFAFDEVPMLSVDRHVDLWRCVLPNDYKYLSTTPHDSEQFWKECLVADAVLRTITWINEAISLSWGRCTRPSIKTHFVGPFDTVQLIWSKVKAVAALYAAAVACARDKCPPFPTRDDLAMAFANEDDAAFSNPELLPVSVRQILSGNSLVQFPCIIGTLDEFNEECQQVSSLLRHRPVEDWEMHRKSILKGVLEEDEVDFKSVQLRYAPHHTRRHV